VAEAHRSEVKPARRLVCPCGAPVTVDPSKPGDRDQSLHDGPLQPKVTPCGTCGRLLVVEDPNVGRLVLGKWKLERRLGQGGMGTVYLATELSVDRPVALKFLHHGLAERDEYRTRFEQEARIMAKVDHPNLVALYGVEREGTVPFLVMKFLKGRPLSRVMKDQKVLSLSQALPLVVQMAAALSALHVRGYVHRDLKPGNVIVADDGHVTVLDFGLTRTAERGLTRPGVALGSPQYMSPEQVLGGALDARSDLYTLGLLTSELLVGHRPYKDESTKAMLLQHLNDLPEPPHLGNAAVPQAVSDVLLKAMNKKPHERHAGVEAFVEALVQAANLGPIQLPRRETAEAMLAAVMPAPVAVKSEAQRDEVAEVVSADTLSLPTPDPMPAPAPRPLQKTVAELARVPSNAAAPKPADTLPGDDDAGAVKANLATELIPAWDEAARAPAHAARPRLAGPAVSSDTVAALESVGPAGGGAPARTTDPSTTADETAPMPREALVPKGPFGEARGGVTRASLKPVPDESDPMSPGLKVAVAALAFIIIIAAWLLLT
jgi:predicted Ser/Thr protein kinase